jgi:hypothetical protein
MVDYKDHFKARSVGSIEAVYNICGYHKHNNSREAYTLSMNPPDMDRKLLRDGVFELNEEDEDIFATMKIGIGAPGSPTPL